MRLYVFVAFLLAAVVGNVSAAQTKQTPTPPPAKIRVAILHDDFPGTDSGLVQALESSLSQRVNLSVATVDQLSAGLRTIPIAYDVIIFPQAQYLPADLKELFIAFLKGGGDIIAIGGPAFSQVVTKTDGKWASLEKDPNTQTDPRSPILESLSPAYQTYPVRAAKLVPNKVYANWAFSAEVKGPVDVVSPIWRPRGLGIGGKRSSRWVPLAYAVDEKGERRGTAAALMFNHNNIYPGSLWGYIGFTGEAYRDTIVQTASNMLVRIAKGSFLLDGGSDKFAYFSGENAKIGAEMIWPGRLAKPMLKISIISSLGPIVYEDKIPLYLKKTVAETNPVIRRSRTWKTNYMGNFYARTDLFDGDKPIDTITHEFTVINAKRSIGQTVTVNGGDFYIGNNKWYPVGVNYWPSYILGSHEGLDWLSPARYDPEIVERDLAQIESLGFNMVSIQYMRASEANTLTDFLERCRRHGLKAHVYMEGFHPLIGNLEKGIDLIKATRLPKNDTVFAYDLAWEPIIGPENTRQQWNGDWQAWVIERYGSVENAEKDWNFAPEKQNGILAGPTDKQLTEDGNWRVMVAAYRRFWDDFLSQRYASIIKRIRAVDTIHLVGARSGYGGTGSPHVAGRMPFDLASGAKHLDFISPESWHIGGDWAGIQPGGAINSYARLVGAQKPVFWAEYGFSIWPYSDAWKSSAQADFCANIYRMWRESGANGGAAWWWPGGYRVSENTDFGMQNPDGTPRLAAALTKDAVAKFASYQRPQPNHWIIVDRDRHVNGYAGIFESTKAEYSTAANSGKVPALKTEGTGTTSVDTPRLAVGNTPLTGSNPPKFLNAEINRLLVKDKKGDWVEPKPGQTIAVGANRSLQVRLSVGNTAEAEWVALPVDQKGAVVLTAATNRGKVYQFPIPKNVPMFDDLDFGALTVIPAVTEPVSLTLQMEAIGKSAFGQKAQITVAP